MLMGRRIAVVVPCHNEERQVAGVLRTMPEEADVVYVVDDGSTDRTALIVDSPEVKNDRIRLIRHPESRGVGAAIASGYRRALEEGADIVVVMAGDGQMDPADFGRVVRPVAEDRVEYCKGNRFHFRDGMRQIPAVRKTGNFILSVLTKIVSGYWHVSDTQCGYTAVSRAALARIDIEGIYPRYGCPNDILVKLSIAECRVAEVPVNPRYGVGEQSKMKVPRVVIPILTLMAKALGHRLVRKYMLRDGHPLVFAYGLALVFLTVSALLGVYLAWMYAQTDLIMKAALFTGGLSLSVGLQLLFTGLWMDCHANEHLCIRLPPELCPPPPPGRTASP